MILRTVAAICLLPLLLYRPALAKEWEGWRNMSDEDMRVTCESLAKVPFPQADMPSAQDRKDLAGCQSWRDYYGDNKDGKVDYVRARKCALIEHETVKSPAMGYGSDVLMMLYANGQGVKRNFNLARRMACEYSWATAERESHLNHLDLMEAKADDKRFKTDNNRSGPHHIDTCDDITSGRIGGLCAVLKSSVNNDKLTRKEDADMASWPAEQQEAFKDLRAKAEAFAKTHSSDEVYLGGTAWMDEMIEEKDNALKLYRNGLDLLTKGAPLPHGEELEKVERKFNRAYESALTKTFIHEIDGHVSTSARTIKQTQLLWLKYRDAYVAFAALRYPQRSADEIKAWLTEMRIDDIEGLPVDRDAAQ